MEATEETAARGGGSKLMMPSVVITATMGLEPEIVDVQATIAKTTEASADAAEMEMAAQAVDAADATDATANATMAADGSRGSRCMRNKLSAEMATTFSIA